MKRVRLIKSQSLLEAPKNSAGTGKSVMFVTRESSLEWVRDYQKNKPQNPRKQFADLFKVIA